ncbi:MAG: hypothetical protein PVI31_08180 [Gemmatimonadota bacterium]
MIRWVLLLALAAGAVAYSLWLYLRVELPVTWGRRLAIARAAALVVQLLLLFDVRVPAALGSDGATGRWVLLDASLSMGAAPNGGASAWDAAVDRAGELDRAGWSVVSFGGATELGVPDDDAAPTELTTLLAPALTRAVEAGVTRVRVLSDLRFEDAVAVRSALGSLPLDVEFERFGDEMPNAGISLFDVPDLARAEGSVTAEVEVHGGAPGDSLLVQVLEEGEIVAEARVPAPSSGLRAPVSIDLPTPSTSGRVRYTARVTLQGDGFPSDDEAVAYATVGTEEQALVVLSVRPDWEPRYLLPVLEEVTGLSGLGYLRAGPDRYVPMGRALDRGGPVDSATVRSAAGDAALLVIHGLGGDSDEWVRDLVGRPGPDLYLLDDPTGADLVGIPTGDPRAEEWYVSSDLPPSPIAGSLAGMQFQGLPPLTNVLLPTDPARARGALFVQLRGAGPLEAAIHLEERDGDRTGVVLASGWWRWAAREDGLEAYRHVWSGVAGWLLGGASVTGAQARPVRWVVDRGEPVTWSSPVDGVERQVVVTRGDSVVAETTVVDRGVFETGVLPPGQYDYRVEGSEADTLATGRFDVAANTEEMAVAPLVTEGSELADGASAASDREPGVPMRTEPWPYLLILALLCGEWIGRRRSGLR